DIPDENNLKLAHLVQSYPWMVYSNTLSTVNTGDDELDAQQLNLFGSFTGLENGSVPSAFVRPQGKTVICIGNSVVLNAEPQDGDSYKWLRNGLEVSGANGTTYTTSQPGQYSVVIEFGSKTIESVPVTITTIAAPNAVVNANGPL